jgi:hypothetical protein
LCIAVIEFAVRTMNPRAVAISGAMSTLLALASYDEGTRLYMF